MTSTKKTPLKYTTGHAEIHRDKNAPLDEHINPEKHQEVDSSYTKELVAIGSIIAISVITAWYLFFTQRHQTPTLHSQNTSERSGGGSADQGGSGGSTVATLKKEWEDTSKAGEETPGLKKHAEEINKRSDGSNNAHEVIAIYSISMDSPLTFLFNPLSLIKLYGELLLDGPSDPYTTKLTNEEKEYTESTIEMIGD